MKKTVLLIASLALATPAQAEMVSMASATVRSNYVYTFARKGCPLSLQMPNQMKFLSDVARLAQMTNAEADLLVLMCFMYNHGTRDGVEPQPS